MRGRSVAPLLHDHIHHLLRDGAFKLCIGKAAKGLRSGFPGLLRGALFLALGQGIDAAGQEGGRFCSLLASKRQLNLARGPEPLVPTLTARGVAEQPAPRARCPDNQIEPATVGMFPRPEGLHFTHRKPVLGRLLHSFALCAQRPWASGFPPPNETALGRNALRPHARLGKPQPFVSKIERGVRRIDVVEFCAIARALKLDPVELFASVCARLPKVVEI